MAETPNRNNFVFTFQDLSSEETTVRKVKAALLKHGAQVAQVEVPNKLKRSSGITYKEVVITFADSQSVTLQVKKTGDIFKVKLNNRDLPIRNQDDQEKALGEIVAKMDKGRSAFQKRLARAKVPLPPKTTSTAKKREEALAEQKAGITEAITAAQNKLNDLKAQIMVQDRRIDEYQAQL